MASDEEGDVYILMSEEGSERVFRFKRGDSPFRQLDTSPTDIEFESRSSVFSVEAADLERLLEKGSITKDVYDERIKGAKEFSRRKELVRSLLEDASYPFVRTPSDMAADHGLGLIDDETYELFVWYQRNGFPDEGGGSLKSFDLKLSIWGLRIMGRYDLCEYSLNRNSSKLIKRLYCVNGTLFEGCGNFKAPDDSFIEDLPKRRTERVFSYLNGLDAAGVTGRDYTESPFNCGFYDLYTRYSNGPTVHTKGTTEYPPFIRFLMFLIGAEGI